MGVLVYADENIIKKLKSHADDGLFAFGLVIAEKSADYICVTHLAPLPSSFMNEGNCEDKGIAGNPLHLTKPNTISSIAETLVAAHSRQVVRMLPGGLDVLGLYVTTPSIELNNSAIQGKLRSILTAVHKSTSKYYLGITDSPLEKIVLHGCTQSLKTGVKSIDLSDQGSSFLSGSLKIEERKWIQLNYNYLTSFPIYIPKEKKSQSLSKNVMSFLNCWAKSLNNNLILLDGTTFSDGNQLIISEDKITKKRDNKTAATDSLVKISEVKFLELLNCSEAIEVSELQECSGSILFTGTVSGMAFIHGKASVQEGFEAVRNDLIRSLVSRWEMHCDSLVEEPHGSSAQPILHEPPRRVFIKEPSCVITLCDYLFPGDSVSDACQSAKELLDIIIQDEDVDDSVEKWADPEEFLATPKSTSLCYVEEKLHDEMSSVQHSNSFQFIVAIVIGISAIALSYYTIISK